MGREARENRRRLVNRLNGQHTPSHLITGAPGDPVVLDAFRRRLQVGDGVLVPNTGTVVWTIEQIHRVLDPRAPAGLILLAVSAQMPVQVADGQPCGLMLVVPQEQTEQAEQAAQPGMPEPPDQTAAAPVEPPTQEGDHTHDPAAAHGPASTSRIVGLDGQPIRREE